MYIFHFRTRSWIRKHRSTHSRQQCRNCITSSVWRRQTTADTIDQLIHICIDLQVIFKLDCAKWKFVSNVTDLPLYTICTVVPWYSAIFCHIYWLLVRITTSWHFKEYSKTCLVGAVNLTTKIVRMRQVPF